MISGNHGQRLGRLLPIAIAFMILDHVASAANRFSITIDATALTPPSVSVPSVAIFPSSAIQSLSLDPGTYTLNYYASFSHAQPSVEFEVNSSGLLEYDPALEGILEGAGTTALVVNGAAITIDNSTLTSPALNFTYVLATVPQSVFVAHLLPGVHQMTYDSNFSGHPQAGALFEVTGSVVTYDSSLEGVLLGSGTSDLTIRGAEIVVDNTFLTTSFLRFTYVLEPVPESVFTGYFLPGYHDMYYYSNSSGQVQAHAAFDVTTSGEVTYDPALEGILLGDGTSSLTIRGAEIVVDNTTLTTPFLRFTYVLEPVPESVFTGYFLPGYHDMYYYSNDIGQPQAHAAFDVLTSGEVSYDPQLEGILLGSGTTSLTIRGAEIVVDNTYLTTTFLRFRYVLEPVPESVFTGYFLPGNHDMYYYSNGGGYPQGHADFDVVSPGVVTYDPALEGILLGVDTTSLTIRGAAIRIAASSLGSGANALMLPYEHPVFSSCDTLYLLPGDHALSAPNFADQLFTVTANATIDFALALDSVWEGRGTSVLQFIGSGGVPDVCNRDPVAVCSGDVSLQATGPDGTLVTLDGSGSYDLDGDSLQFHWDVSDIAAILDDPDSMVPSGTFPIGTTMATLTVTDGNGGVSTCDTVVTVIDTTPPTVMCSSNLATLWPPNHKMRSVSLLVEVTDLTSMGPVPIVAVLRSDEPDDAPGNGDGNTTGDVNGFDGYSAPVDVTSQFVFNPLLGPNGSWIAVVQLRAERQGTGDGRCYTLDVVATDGFGNESYMSCCIVVPHNQ